MLGRQAVEGQIYVCPCRYRKAEEMASTSVPLQQRKAGLTSLILSLGKEITTLAQGRKRRKLDEDIK